MPIPENLDLEDIKFFTKKIYEAIEKTKSKTELSSSDKEKCKKCNVELKWVQLSLICPKCKKVFAG